MSRILVAHGSRFGRTCTIADAIAKRLRTRGHDVEIALACNGPLPPPEDYDAVILGSRVALGHHSSEILEYVREHKDTLGAMPTAFFSVSPAAGVPFTGKDPRGHLADTFRELGWTPDHAMALGRIGTPQPNHLADLMAVGLPDEAPSELSATFGPV